MVFVLAAESQRFASDLSQLLNATVCNGPQLKSLVFPKYTVVGYEVGRFNVRGQGIPLTLTRAPASLFLTLSVRLRPNDEQDHLMVQSSAMVLALDADVTNSNMLLHYDSERDKGDGYPEAHMQICASSEAWRTAGQRLNGDMRLLDKLHLPVGGRRFRPTLEDIIEFLVVEQLVEARPGWREQINQSRESFREQQLRAAIRRNPMVALDQLQRDGHLHREAE